MELNDLKMLAAASLLSGSVFDTSSSGGRVRGTKTPSESEILAAVKCAQQIWEAVLRKERE